MFSGGKYSLVYIRPYVSYVPSYVPLRMIRPSSGDVRGLSGATAGRDLLC
jgi:hypothetical protein